jgi:hypothetical protein
MGLPFSEEKSRRKRNFHMPIDRFLMGGEEHLSSNLELNSDFLADVLVQAMIYNYFY